MADAFSFSSYGKTHSPCQFYYFTKVAPTFFLVLRISFVNNEDRIREKGKKSCPARFYKTPETSATFDKNVGRELTNDTFSSSASYISLVF